MGLLTFIKNLFETANSVESGIRIGFRFTKNEIREILSSSRKENLKYFEVLAKMPNLKSFDISFLMSQTKLDDDKIAVIEKAQTLFNEKEFTAYGQTRSDFIFRVGANLQYLNLDNIETFKELVKCKNEIYDFSSALENPVRYLIKKEQHLGYAFETICLK